MKINLEEAEKHVIYAIITIINEVAADVIKNYTVSPVYIMDDANTPSGMAVEIQVSTMYHYDEQVLARWKQAIGANDWYIRVSRNRLFLHFLINYNTEIN